MWSFFINAAGNVDKFYKQGDRVVNVLKVGNVEALFVKQEGILMFFVASSELKTF